MTHKHAELIKAWADGAEIQVQEPNGLWRDTDPLWTEDRKYRIKSTPPKREWVGLTDEDIYSIIEDNVPPKLNSLFGMAEWISRIVEAKLKEMNNA